MNTYRIISYYSVISMTVLLKVVMERAHTLLSVTDTNYINDELKVKQHYKERHTNITDFNDLEYKIKNEIHMTHSELNKSFETYDAAESKFRDFVSPNVLNLVRLTDRRDEFLTSSIVKQDAMYRPITESSGILENNLQYIIDDKNYTAEEYLFPVQELLEGIKFNIDSTTNARNVVAPGFAICILNPQCCISPVSCAPN